MRCSKCSAPVRPIVAVDIDGTLGDYHAHFQKFAVAYVGAYLPSLYTGEVPFNEFLGLDKRTYRDIKLAYRQGAQKRSMPVYPGASPFMNNLKAAGIETWITTTRPYMRLDNVDPDTRFWLEQHNMPYYGMIYDEDKYEQLVSAVDPERIVLVVEDLLEQCSRAGGLGLEVWQPHRTYNHKTPWDNRFYHFDEVTARVHEKVKNCAHA